MRNYNRNLSVKMNLVNGGSFYRFDDDDEETYVNSFYMATTPITQGFYEKIMGTNPTADSQVRYIGFNKPIYHLTWAEVITFCNVLSKRDGLTPCYLNPGINAQCNWYANGYRLPTLAEWMYAARGGKNDDGYEYSGSDDIDEVAWYEGNSGGVVHPVNQKMPNSLGLYDMSGNLKELCWDWVDIDYCVDGSCDYRVDESDGFNNPHGFEHNADNFEDVVAAVCGGDYCGSAEWCSVYSYDYHEIRNNMDDYETCIGATIRLVRRA